MKKLFSVILAVILFSAPWLSMVKADAAFGGKWLCTWSTSIVDGGVTPVAGMSLQDIIPAKSTIRIELQVATGGSKLKFHFSNKFGVSDMTINEASVAKTKGEGKATIEDGTQTPITFNEGYSFVTIPAGEDIWSDEIKINTDALERISISLYFENMTYITSTGLANARTFMGLNLLPLLQKGSQVTNTKLSSPSEVNITSATVTYHTTPFLSDINTLSSDPYASTAVFIGDSTLVNNTYLYFAERLVNAGIKNISVINEAIIGNKLLSNGSGLIGNLCGVALIDRFENDVLSQTGVKYVFVKIGLNDIAHQFSKSLSSTTPKYTAKAIIAGYERLVQMAHAKGLKIYFFSKTPWKGYERAFLGQKGDLVWNMQMQSMCDELDEWIKTPGTSDGFIDCSGMNNPADPYALCPSFTIDGAHLTNLGSIAMADLIPLSFVGVNASNVKTAAEINGVDPYAERNTILYNLENPTTVPSTDPEMTAPEEVTTTQQPTTTPVTEPESQTAIANGTISPDSQLVWSPEVTTVPEYVTGEGNMFGNNVGVNYIVEDNIDTIGGNGSIIFVLILFLVLVVAGTVVILTVSKKKENEFG